MKRGTTPLHIFTLPKYIDISDFAVIYITYAQFDETVVERDITSIQRDTEKNALRVILTQQETLRFKAFTPTGFPANAEIQIRMLDGTNAIASEIMLVPVEKILKEGVI